MIYHFFVYKKCIINCFCVHVSVWWGWQYRLMHEWRPIPCHFTSSWGHHSPPQSGPHTPRGTISLAVSDNTHRHRWLPLVRPKATTRLHTSSPRTWRAAPLDVASSTSSHLHVSPRASPSSTCLQVPRTHILFIN